MIFAILPFALCIGGILRYVDRIENWSIFTATLFSVLVAIAGICVELENKKLRNSRKTKEETATNNV